MTDTLDAIAREEHGVAKRLRRIASSITDKSPDQVAQVLRDGAECIDTIHHVKMCLVAEIKKLQAEITALSNQGEGECWDAIAIYEAIGRGDIGYEDKFYTRKSAPAEADRRDAERYRWLRSPMSAVPESVMFLASDAFDKMVDAAIAATQEQT